MINLRRSARPRRSWRRALGPLLVAAIAAMVPVAAAPPASAASTGPRLATFDTALLHSINQARASHGAPPLQSDGGLVQLAEWWSTKMAAGATGGKLQHNPNAWSMLVDYGAANRTAWAENVASFSLNIPADALFNAYMASPGHRANILNATYRYVGIGTVAGASGEYNTMEFTDRVEPGGCHPFVDVDSASVHCRDVGWLSARKITTPDGRNYRPFQSVTRGAMAAFLYRLVNPGKTPTKCSRKPFPDVAAGSAFCAYITWAKSAGIVAGYLDGTYRPGDAVDRGAMAAYLARAVNADSGARCTSKPFADVAISNPFCREIAWLKAQGITQGFSGGTYRPVLEVSRQAMASFLRREAPLV